MPIQLRFEGPLLIADIRGILGSSDLMAAAQDLAQIDTESDPTPDRLVDLSTADGMSVDFSAVCAFAEVRMASSFKNKVKTAFIAKTQVQYGFARMYQTLNRNPLLSIEVFREKRDALAWLAKAAGVNVKCV